jgi:hypothetical protein
LEFEVTHETSQLAGVVDVQQQVVMRGQEDVETAADFVAFLGASEDAGDDLIGLPSGEEEKAVLEGPAGDLDQGTVFWDEAKSSAHTPRRRKNDPESDSS